MEAAASLATRVMTFVPEPPIIGAERILRLQGYRDLSRVRPAISRAACDMALVAERLAGPRVAWCRIAIQALGGGVVALEGGASLRCDAFDEKLAGCSEILPFVLSVGIPLGEHIVEVAERGDLLEAVLLETAGWLAIEDATRQFRSRMRESVRASGLRITPRMGPGYTYRHGDQSVMWSLEEQVALFGLFGEADLPATLLPSCAMNPKLSRSGIHGLAPLSPPATATRPGAPAHEELQQ